MNECTRVAASSVEPDRTPFLYRIQAAKPGVARQGGEKKRRAEKKKKKTVTAALAAAAAAVPLTLQPGGKGVRVRK